MKGPKQCFAFKANNKTTDVRPDGPRSIGIAVVQSGLKKQDFRGPLTRKIKGLGVRKTL